MSESTPLLLTRGLRYGFASRPAFLGPIDLALGGGQFWGVIGPNGAGKSTLLRLLAGLWVPASGTVTLAGTSMGVMPAAQRARRIAFLPQHPPGGLQATVREIVLMGRFPHRRYRLFDAPRDDEIADDAMQATGVASFADRRLESLSGGEAQRVHLAAVLAQQTRVMLLDEPTGALDLHHQLDVAVLLRRLAHREKLLVVMVTHDVNLAGQFCDRILLLDNGRPVARGTPEQVLDSQVLAPVYDVRFGEFRPDGARCAWVFPLSETGA